MLLLFLLFLPPPTTSHLACPALALSPFTASLDYLRAQGAKSKTANGRPARKCASQARNARRPPRARSLGRSIDLGRCRRWACTCSLGRAGTGGLSVRCALARSPQSGQSQASVIGPWWLVGWLAPVPGQTSDRRSTH